MDVLNELSRNIDIPPSIVGYVATKILCKGINVTTPLVRMNVIKREMKETCDFSLILITTLYFNLIRVSIRKDVFKGFGLYKMTMLAVTIKANVCAVHQCEIGRKSSDVHKISINWFVLESG